MASTRLHKESSAMALFCIILTCSDFEWDDIGGKGAPDGHLMSEDLIKADCRTAHRNASEDLTQHRDSAAKCYHCPSQAYGLCLLVIPIEFGVGAYRPQTSRELDIAEDGA